MFKEVIISAAIVIAIIVLDILLGRFVDDKMNHTVELLNNVEISIRENNYEEANKKLKETDEFWKNSEEMLSFYIEHEELEKVDKEFTSLNTFIELENEEALEKVNNVAYIIKHIEEKDDLKLKNIF